MPKEQEKNENFVPLRPGVELNEDTKIVESDTGDEWAFSPKGGGTFFVGANLGRGGKAKNKEETDNS